MVSRLVTVSGLGLTIAALLVGISDNPPGIALLYVGVAAIVTALASRWQHPRKFIVMVLVSAVCFPVFVLLENVLGAASESWDSALGDLLGVAGAAAFVLATVLCPVTLVVGVVGGAVHWLRASSA